MYFGIVLHLTADYASWNNVLLLAKEAERLGYDSVWVSDHFRSPHGAHSLEAWTVLSSIAASTRTIRLGTYVLCNQFRHPSLVAKMATTLDLISQGRLDLGIGAGWYKEEHRSFGFPWDRHRIRLERLKETLTVLTGLWTKERCSFHGQHYQITDAELVPKPLQQPHPPIWIGGTSPQIQQLVAEYGDGWIPVLPTPHKLGDDLVAIKSVMQSIGRNPEQLRVAYGGSNCIFVSSKASAVDRVRSHIAQSSGAYRNCIIGTPRQCIAKIEQYEGIGVNAIIGGFHDFPSLKSLQLFATTVFPSFKK